MELSKSASTDSLAMCVLKAGMTVRLKWLAGHTTTTIDLHSMVGCLWIHVNYIVLVVWALLSIYVHDPQIKGEIRRVSMAQ